MFLEEQWAGRQASWTSVPTIDFLSLPHFWNSQCGNVSLGKSHMSSLGRFCCWNCLQPHPPTLQLGSVIQDLTLGFEPK